MFPVEHNQIWNVKGEVKRRLPEGFWAKLGFQADAGLPFDLSNGDGTSLNETQAKQILKQRGWSDAAIDLLDLSEESPGSPDRSTSPKILFDLATGWDSPETRMGILHVELGCRNVFDTPYLTRFETSLGGTHWGEPRTFFVSTNWML